MIEVTVKHKFTDEQIGDWIVTMLECNDMTASWCNSFRLDKPIPAGCEYFQALAQGITIWVETEDLDWDGEGDVKYKEYPLTEAALIKAFELMSNDMYDHIVYHFTSDNYDAIDVDVLLQFTLFGEVAYC